MSYDYYNYGTYGNTGVLAALGGALIFISILSLAAAVFGIIVMWKIFKKAGKEGWIAIIPLYNAYTLFEITWGSGWYFLLLLLAIIPVLGWIACIVITIITMVKLAKVFGKSGGFAVGLIFLSVIFLAILAFDKSTYLGVAASGSTGPQPQPQNDFQNPQMNQIPPTQNEMNNPEPTQTRITGYCINCGAGLPEGIEFCPNCGTKRTS